MKRFRLVSGLLLSLAAICVWLLFWDHTWAGLAHWMGYCLLGAGVSTYAAIAELKALLGKAGGSYGTYTSAPSLYLALCTSSIAAGDTGATLVEATYTGYARKSTVATDWNTPTTSSVTNSAEIAFAACGGGSSTVTYFALVDNATTGQGNVIRFGQLTSPLSVSNGITPRFAAGALTLGET